MKRDRLVIIAAWVDALSPHDRREFEALLTKRKRGRPSYGGQPSPLDIEKERARAFYRALVKQPGMTTGAALRQTKEASALDPNVVERACGFRHEK